MKEYGAIKSLVGERVAWKAYYITSRRFYHLPLCRQCGYNRLPQFNSEIQNIHTFYRKEFVLKNKKIKRAKLFITADDIYKLYLNSALVGEGPAQSYPFAYNYNCYDVTELLQSGENVIAVHVYYGGLFNLYLMSADNLSGMIAQLEVEYEDSEKEIIISDRSWVWRECEAYTPAFLYGYQTQFSEDIDMSKLCVGWKESNYADASWQNADVVSYGCPAEYNFVPQITPPVSYERIYPVEIKQIEGGYFFDFGKEIAATLHAVFNGNGGDVVEIRFGEELNADGRVRFEIRANCKYSDKITLSGGEDVLDYFDYKGYRYAEIIGAPSGFDVSDVFSLSRHYPFPKEPASFHCSDSNLNGIWDICAYGVKIGTQDTYYDCMTREKGGFVGDAYITGLSHLLLTADTRIYEKFIFDLKNSSRYCPTIMAHIPSYNINICVEYSALAPFFIEQFYNYTGNKSLVKESLFVVEGVWEYYSQFLNDDGVLEAVSHMPKVPEDMECILIDWPQNLRDGYDMKAAEEGVCTTVNMFFYGLLKSAARLYRIIGDEERAAHFEKLYTKMGQGIISLLYDPTDGLFFDATESEHKSLHANAMQLFFGLEVPGGYNKIRDLLMQKGLNCGVYFAFFVIEGLYKAGYYEDAYRLLMNESEHSWVNMLREGATTCMEVWGADQKWNCSWCHPWSSSPIYFVTSRVMGIDLDGLGEGKLRICPHIDQGLEYATLSLPLPCGRVTAKFVRCDGKIEYFIDAPSSLEVVFEEDDDIVYKKEHIED